ncbi:MAG: pirin family protein [Alphaproteobacteria bacterium]|nr:pirin family protein [Alphaproteobacteria bacterium]
MASHIDLVISPRDRDLGGFSVRRVLPFERRRSVGPFVFFDHFGPVTFAPGDGIDVRPHPHIGLSTVTYLFEGEIVHRDSLGYVQPIQPGAVNWMNAGSGIVHSERSGDEERARQSRLHGIQSWVAVPHDREESEPGFFHHPADTLPRMECEGGRLTLIAGSLGGETAPVETLSRMFYADLTLTAGGSMGLEAGLGERAVYVVDGRIRIGDAGVESAEMAVLADGIDVAITADENSRVMLLGGAPLDGERHVWWNFVSSSKDRIARAKEDWREGRFDTVPGDDEFIPLPEEDT